MVGVSQALSVPTVDLSRYQTPLIGTVGTRKGMSSTLSWVVIHICWLASGLCGEIYQWNSLTIKFPGYTFFITYFQHMTILSTFTHHIYLRVGDIERTWLTKSVIPNTLIQFDSNTFPADTRTTFHTRATFLASVLYYYM